MFGFVFIIGLNPVFEDNSGCWETVGCELFPKRFIPKLVWGWGDCVWGTTGVVGAPKLNPRLTGWETGWTGCGEVIPKPIKSAPKPRLLVGGATVWGGLGVDILPKPKRSPPNAEFVGCAGCETVWDGWEVPISNPKMLNGSLFWTGVETTGLGWLLIG